MFFDCCPKKEKVGRILKMAGIGYSHTARWWQNAKNIQKVREWRAANPRQFMQTKRQLRFCGTCRAFGAEYKTDIDLGGDYNIAPEEDYERILQQIQQKKLTQWQISVVNKSEIVELANGEFVQIDKWLTGKLMGRSITQRDVTAYRVEFGFAQAWTGRLIIGRHTADLFGFKDAQKQYLDAQQGPTMAADEFEAKDVQHVQNKSTASKIPPLDTKKQYTRPTTTAGEAHNVTAMGTAYVGKHAYKHLNATDWTFDPMLKYSYITSAAWTRSAAPKNVNPPAPPDDLDEHDDDDPIGDMCKRLQISEDVAKRMIKANKRPSRTSNNSKTHSSRPVEMLGHAAQNMHAHTPTDDDREEEPAWAKQFAEDEHQRPTTDEKGTGMATTFDAEAADARVSELLHPQHAHIHDWLRGTQPEDDDDENQTRTKVVTIPHTNVLQARQRMVQLKNQTFIVVPSDDIKVVFGRRAMQAIQAEQECDPSPLRQTTPAEQQKEVDDCIRDSLDEVRLHVPEITSRQMARLTEIVMMAKKRVWRSKYALDEPAHAHPMEIKLKPGAQPPKGGLPRRKFTQDQHEFLRSHLKILEEMGVISKHEGPWACPIVLVLKPDQTWRLCVDPSHLNACTETLVWDMPEPAKDVQSKLTGSKYFASMDLIKSFWQFELSESSKHLFSFYAHPYGQYRFERVAMGAKNSSAYVQKTMTGILKNANLLGKGVEVTTDDIIMHASTIDELIGIIQSTLQVLDEHNLHAHPGKVKLMRKQLIFNGMLITGDGIAVDPSRVKGLTTMPLPRTVGDVYQFYCAAGWLRSHVPKIAELIAPLRNFVTNVFVQRKIKKRTMVAADKIQLTDTDWNDANIQHFLALKLALLQTIIRAYRDPEKQVCIFTDASTSAWSYIITQCDIGELDKPWEIQQHEILAVNSGMFRNAQINWDMCCKEAYPIREAFERHRGLLHSRHPVVSVNDHRNLLYIATDAYRHSTVSTAARHRLARWALYMTEEDIRVVHIPGIQNHLADLLSRNGNPAYNRMQRMMHHEDQNADIGATRQTSQDVPHGPADADEEERDEGSHTTAHENHMIRMAMTLDTRNASALDETTQRDESTAQLPADAQQNTTTGHQHREESEDSDDSSLFSSDYSSYQYSDDESEMSYESVPESLATIEARQIPPPQSRPEQRTRQEEPAQPATDDAPPETSNSVNVRNHERVEGQQPTANTNTNVQPQRQTEANINTSPKKRTVPPQKQPPTLRQRYDTDPPPSHVAHMQWDADTSPMRKRTRHNTQVAHNRRSMDRLSITEIKPSTIPWAGRGLFAARAIAKGERVARYGGEPLTRNQAARRHSRYKLQVHTNLILDANSEYYDNLRGKFINDGKINGRKPNVRFSATRKPAICPITGQLWISVVAIRNIPKNAELLADYGPLYRWRRHATDKKRAVIDACNTDTTIQAQRNGDQAHIHSKLPTIYEHDCAPSAIENEPEQLIPGNNELMDAWDRIYCTPCDDAQSVRQSADSSKRHMANNKATGRQFLIIKPNPPKIDNTLLRGENNLTGQHLMPDRQDINIPTAKMIATAQKKLPIKVRRANATIQIHGQKLYVNKRNKIMIPESAMNLQMALMALAHQDQHAHRSIDDSVARLREFFTFPDLKDRMTVFAHTCLHCMKIRGGVLMPRPTWEMMRATVPFEYVHSDWMDMPTASNGHKYLMIIIDDLSGTVLLHSAASHTAEETARAYVHEWLSHYPDPTILHTDGGSHYVNSLLRTIADIRGYEHHITAPHAKWSHGVGERINRKCLDAFLQIMAQLQKDQKEWPDFTKLIQAHINRTPTKSRGGLSPIQITTGLKAKSTFQHVLFQEHDAKMATAIPLQSELIQDHIDNFITGLEETWGQASQARNAQSTTNIKARKQIQTVPQLEIGEYVLMAQPERISKLEFKWVGPLRITNTISDFVYECKPISKRNMRPRIVHITRLRRFASKYLNVTEQIQRSADRDFPDCEVQRLIAHKINPADGELHIKVHWLGFTQAERTWEAASSLHKYVPAHVRAYTHEHRQDKNCENFFNAHYL